MRAIFQSNKAYLQIMRSAIMTVAPVYCETGEYYSESGIRVKVRREMVGTSIRAVSPGEDCSLIFCEGNKHNQLTLTDPAEIEAMRKFAEDRHDIWEISLG